MSTHLRKMYKCEYVGDNNNNNNIVHLYSAFPETEFCSKRFTHIITLADLFVL